MMIITGVATNLLKWQRFTLEFGPDKCSHFLLCFFWRMVCLGSISSLPIDLGLAGLPVYNGGGMVICSWSDENDLYGEFSYLLRPKV